MYDVASYTPISSDLKEKDSGCFRGKNSVSFSHLDCVDATLLISCFKKVLSFCATVAIYFKRNFANTGFL